jgi:photosystem II stability/assembly factor-like uncharacterized protein
VSDDLERRLATHYQDLTPIPSGRLGPRIAQALDEAPRRSRSRLTWVGRAPRLALVALTVVALVMLPLWRTAVVAPAASSTPRPSTTPSPSTSPTPVSRASPSALPENLEASVVDATGLARSRAIWVRRGSSLLVSGDGGQTWRAGTVPLPAPNTIEPTIYMLDTKYGWSLTPGPGSINPEGGQGPTWDHLHLLVNRTSDGGQTWKAASVPGDYPEHVLGLSFVDASHGFLIWSAGRASLTGTTILRTDDGGATWAIVRTVPAGESGTLGSIFVASDPSTLWAGAQPEAGPVNHPILAVSRDGGGTWSNATLPGLDPRFGGTSRIPIGPPVFLDASTGVVGIEDTATNPESLRFYRTTDGGRSWKANPPLDSPFGYGQTAIIDTDHWLVSTPSALRETIDAGSTWHDLAASGFPSVSGVHVLGFTDAQHGAALVGLGGSYLGASALFVTLDGGRSWRPGDFQSGGIAWSPPTPVQDAASAKQIAETFTVASDKGGWALLWDLLSPYSQAAFGSADAFQRYQIDLMGQSAGSYQVGAPVGAPEALFDSKFDAIRADLNQTADPSRAFRIVIAYSGGKPSAQEQVLVIAPLLAGGWRIWLLP